MSSVFITQEFGKTKVQTPTLPTGYFSLGIAQPTHTRYSLFPNLLYLSLSSVLSRWCYEPSAAVIQQNPFSAFPARPASARHGGGRGEARHICRGVCEERGRGQPQPPRALPQLCGLAPLLRARLARPPWLIIKWLVWLCEGRTSLALCDVLRCLAGAWQALGFLAGAGWEGDGAIFVPKVVLRVPGLKSTGV